MEQNLAYDVSSITVASNEAEQQRPAMAAPIPPVGHVAIVMPDTCVGKTVLLPKSEFNCATCLRYTIDKIKRSCTSMVCNIIYLILIFGFSVASIVIGALNNGSDSSLLELNTWPHCTSAEWLIIYGVLGILLGFLNELYNEKRNRRPFIIIMVNFILGIFSLIWLLIGVVMIFTNGYDKQYFTYAMYIMICIPVYILIIFVCLMFQVMLIGCVIHTVQ